MHIQQILLHIYREIERAIGDAMTFHGTIKNTVNLSDKERSAIATLITKKDEILAFYRIVLDKNTQAKEIQNKIDELWANPAALNYDVTAIESTVLGIHSSLDSICEKLQDEQPTGFLSFLSEPTKYPFRNNLLPIKRQIEGEFKPQLRKAAEDTVGLLASMRKELLGEIDSVKKKQEEQARTLEETKQQLVERDQQIVIYKGKITDLERENDDLKKQLMVYQQKAQPIVIHTGVVDGGTAAPLFTPSAAGPHNEDMLKIEAASSSFTLPELIEVDHPPYNTSEFNQWKGQNKKDYAMLKLSWSVSAPRFMAVCMLANAKTDILNNKSQMKISEKGIIDSLICTLLSKDECEKEWSDSFQTVIKPTLSKELSSDLKNLLASFELYSTYQYKHGPHFTNVNENDNRVNRLITLAGILGSDNGNFIPVNQPIAGLIQQLAMSLKPQQSTNSFAKK